MLDSVLRPTDPVTREVILSGIKAAVDEMDVLIGRAAMSPVIKEKKDYFMGLFDAGGRMIHVLTSYSGPGIVQPVLDRFPADRMKPGDVFFFNDPYSSRGAVGHLPDIVIVIPFFAEGGRLMGFSATFGHLADIGGLRYGSGAMDARDIFHEGTAFPPMQVGRDGEIDPHFMEMLLRATRCPDLVQGDWRALHAGCLLGVARAEALIGRWGARAFSETVDWSIERSAAELRRLLDEDLADGEYAAVNYMDGRVIGLPRVKVGTRVIKRGRELILDLTEADDQVAAPLNYIASLNGARLLMLIQLATLGTELGNNEGALQSFTEIRVRPGSVVAPLFPAALSARAMPRAVVINNLSVILDEMTGGKIAASSPTHVVCHFELANGRTFGETLGVGMGARPFGDGPDVIYGSAQRNYPVEQVEPAYPIRIERYAIRRDSGGAGLWRGGCGVERAIRVLADGNFSPRLSHTSVQCPGTNGGRPGMLGEVTVLREGAEPMSFPGTYGNIPVQRGDLVVLASSGGGGWGDPLQRPAELVLRDVRERFVSVEEAWRSYGVRIVDGGIDREATAAGPRGTPA